ncbi:tetratricopeptide repeat protein 22 [Platysternon megacephalum]|uniref:Tetratricopeptide repeat protein 22 n=1 Tax=Platysternon megacephalum TaxID=55544 RepID=A0A4D9EU97_9SAUR|nr:tetratricopeptide repeat protein 22 [Platysternon megacephalum]
MPQPDFPGLMGGIDQLRSPLPERSGQMDPAGSQPPHPPHKVTMAPINPSFVMLVAGSQPCSLNSLVTTRTGNSQQDPGHGDSPQGNTHCHHCHHGNPPPRWRLRGTFC